MLQGESKIFGWYVPVERGPVAGNWAPLSSNVSVTSPGVDGDAMAACDMRPTAWLFGPTSRSFRSCMCEMLRLSIVTVSFSMVVGKLLAMLMAGLGFTHGLTPSQIVIWRGAIMSVAE